MKIRTFIIKHRLILTAIVVASVALFGAAKVYAGNPFYPWALVFYSNNGVKTAGDATTVNSKATAYSYRTTTDGNPTTRIASNFGITDSPGDNQIFPAAQNPGDPAYATWDVGSTSWTFTPLTGDVDVLVLQAYNGLNGWTGQSYVGGAKTTLTDAMLGNSEADFHDIVMEPIPTPTMQSNTTSSITIHWQGLWDNDKGASGGAGPNSVVGYTIYRSVDGAGFSAFASMAQNAGGNIAYTDSTASTGHTYQYKLGVRFEWQAHSGGYFEPSAQGPASASLSTGLPQPVMVKYLNTAPTIIAGTTSAIQTVQSSDVSGNAVNTTSDTTVNLTTTSTSPNAKFYAVSGGICTSTQITSVTILNGTNTAQFCYYDEAAGSWALTAAVTGWTSATETATVNASNSLGSLTLVLASPQKNRIAFVGTNTLTAKDTYGNTMTAFSAASDTITFAATPGTAVVGGLSGGAQLTAAGDFVNGVANLTNKFKLSGTAGTYTITASSASGKNTTASVTLNGGAIDHFDFVLASPQTIATAFTGTNTITAKDIDNNVITDFNAATTNVTVAESAGTGTVSGLGSGGNGILNRSGDFVNGVANLASAMQYVGPASNHTFKATAGTATSTSGTVSFSPGPLAKFGVNLSTPQTNARAFATATITAQDAYGNTITNFDASADHVTLATSGTGSLNTTQLTSSSAFVSSVANLSGSLTFTGQAGAHTLTVTSASGKSGSANFTVNAGATTSIKIVNGSGSGATQVTTASLTADQTLPLWAAGYDVSGNWTGLVNGDWGSTGTLAPAVTNTGANTITFAPTTAPTSGTITVTSGGMNAATGTITVGVGALNHFVVNGPATATAGVQTTISMTAVDADGNTITTYTGPQTINFSGPGNGPTNGAPTYPASVTFSGGTATNVPITLVKAEIVKLTAKQGAITGTSGDIVVSAANANSFGVSAPGVATAGAPFAVTITSFDQYGNVNQNYNGDHVITFANPTNAPDGTPPAYPSSITFNSGVSTGSVTLYNRETTTLKATESTLTGTSGPIVVGAGNAATIAQVSGDHQTGPVSQLLAAPIKVIVKDTYQNPVSSYNVTFTVTSGGGQVTSSSVATATDGTAQTTWRMGSMPGIDNNTAQATGSGLTGSPLSFTASASGNGFVISTPTNVKTGVPFTVQIKVVDMNGATVTSYTGTKTLTFSGPSNGPNGDKPVYPVSVDFTNGVATPPSITLVAVETTTLTATDAGASLAGTTDPFSVDAGAAAKLAIVTPPQQLAPNDVSAPITVCVQDQYGNAVIGNTDRQLGLAGTSPGSKFATSKDGPWDSYYATLSAGLNCMDIYYKDSYAGARTVTISASGLTEASQPIVITGTSEQPQPPTGGGGSGGSSTTTTNTVTRTVTVYTNSPTAQATLPNPSPTTTIAVPTVQYPIITSPSDDAFIASISGNVIVEGTAPPNQALQIFSENGARLGSATSDQYGQWRALVDQNKFVGPQQNIYAQLINPVLRSPSVSFALKQPTWLERAITFVTNYHY